MLTNIKCDVSISLQTVWTRKIAILWTQVLKHWSKPFRQKCDKHAALGSYKHGTGVIGTYGTSAIRALVFRSVF